MVRIGGARCRRSGAGPVAVAANPSLLSKASTTDDASFSLDDEPLSVDDDSGPAFDPPVVTNALEVVLPVSWFIGYEDPTQDHPLFVRDLPDARVRATRRKKALLPAVKVVADENLEPDGFRVSIDGVDKVSGHASAEQAYCETAWVPGLASGVRKLAVPAASFPGMVEIPKDALTDAVSSVIASSATAAVIQRTAESWHEHVAPEAPTNGQS